MATPRTPIPLPDGGTATAGPLTWGGAKDVLDVGGRDCLPRLAAAVSRLAETGVLNVAAEVAARVDAGEEFGAGDLTAVLSAALPHISEVLAEAAEAALTAPALAEAVVRGCVRGPDGTPLDLEDLPVAHAASVVAAAFAASGLNEVAATVGNFIRPASPPAGPTPGTGPGA